MSESPVSQADIPFSDNEFSFEYFGKSYCITRSVQLLLQELKDNNHNLIFYITLLLNFQHIPQDSLHFPCAIHRLVGDRADIARQYGQNTLAELEYYMFGKLLQLPDINNISSASNKITETAQEFLLSDGRQTKDMEAMKMYLEYVSSQSNKSKVIRGERHKVRKQLQRPLDNVQG